MQLNTGMKVNRITDEVWEIPTSEKSGMLVPARIYGTPGILQSMDQGVFDQVTNVACLPGIQRYALCMPDGHWGYGFPIGGVAAFDVREGVISPGGVGYDVNCGMRLIRTDLTLAEVAPRLPRLMDELFRRVPAGVGAGGSVKLSRSDLNAVMVQGARWCVEQGYGWHRDLERSEEGGCIRVTDPSTGHPVDERRHRRERLQARTVGVEGDVGQVVVHPDRLEHVVLADPRPRGVERGPVDGLWRGLDPDRDVPARHRALTGRSPR